MGHVRIVAPADARSMLTRLCAPGHRCDGPTVTSPSSIVNRSHNEIRQPLLDAPCQPGAGLAYPTVYPSDHDA
jgi:hypothetical protein